MRLQTSPDVVNTHDKVVTGYQSLASIHIFLNLKQRVSLEFWPSNNKASFQGSNSWKAVDFVKNKVENTIKLVYFSKHVSLGSASYNLCEFICLDHGAVDQAVVWRPGCGFVHVCFDFCCSKRSMAAELKALITTVKHISYVFSQRETHCG